MKKGEIWLVDIPKSGGHEQQDTRPVVFMAQLEANIATVIPCTTNMKALRFPHVLEFEPNEKNGLSSPSVALIFQLRAIDKKRLIKKIGTIDNDQLITIDATIKSMLKLS